MKGTPVAHSSDTKRVGRKIGIFASIVVVAALGLTACSAPNAPTAGSTAKPAKASKPSNPIQLTILDGGGDLKGGGQAAIDAFVKANPDLVSGVSYQTAAATDVGGKLLAQSSGGAVTTSLVLGGPDVLGSLQKQKLLTTQLPAYASSLPDFTKIQDQGRSNFQKASNGQGILINYDQNGPFIDYQSPVTSSDAPNTPQALLAWAKANPGKFSYAQPANSGSGRAFIETLPYILGDSNPSDPVHGWSKTWAYLKDLGKYVTSYPSSSSLLAQQFGGGQLRVIPTVISHDISFRKAGTYPPDTGITLFKNQNWITDGHYSMIPAGVSPETLYVDLKLESYMVGEEAQKQRLSTGVLTTANKNVTTENSGDQVKAFVQKWGRPDFYPEALKTGKVRVPLTPDALQNAFTIWQQNIGSSVGQ